MKRLFEKIHIKYPFVDPLVNLLLGSAMGTFGGKAVDDLSGNWKFWESQYFWICIVMLGITILYFARYSSYSRTKKGRVTIAKEILNETLIRTATKELAKSSSIEELLRNGRRVKVFVDTLDDVEDMHNEIER